MEIPKNTAQLGFTKPVINPRDPTKKVSLDDVVIPYMSDMIQNFVNLFGCPMHDVSSCVLFYVAGVHAMQGDLKDPLTRQRMLTIANTGFDQAAELKEDIATHAPAAILTSASLGELDALCESILRQINARSSGKPGRKK